MGESKGCKKHRRQAGPGVHRVRSKRPGNRGGRDQFATLDAQHRNILKGILSIPGGRRMDEEARNGKFWDRNTGLFLRPKGVKSAIEQVNTGLLMSEINGDPE